MKSLSKGWILGFFMFVIFQMTAVGCKNPLGSSEQGSKFSTTYNPGLDSLVVIGLENSGILRTKTWTWSCNWEPCQYRWAITQSPSWVPTGDFSSVQTATQLTGDGTYYLHVQAKSIAEQFSDVFSVSVDLDNSGPVFSSEPSLGPNDATPVKARSVTWAAATDVGTGLADYEIALGTTAGEDDVVAWRSIGVRTSYQITDQLDGVSVLLPSDTALYLAVRAIDQLGNRTLKTLSSFKVDQKYYCGLNYDCPVFQSSWDATILWANLFAVLDEDYEVPVKVDFGFGHTATINGHAFEDMAVSTAAAASLIGITRTNIEIKSGGMVSNLGVTFNNSNGLPGGTEANLLATGIAYRNFVTEVSGLIPGAAYFFYIPLYGWNQANRSNNLTPSDTGIAYLFGTGANYSRLLRYGFIADANGKFSLLKNGQGGIADGICFHGVFVVRAQAAY